MKKNQPHVTVGSCLGRDTLFIILFIAAVDLKILNNESPTSLSSFRLRSRSSVNKSFSKVKDKTNYLYLYK